MADAALRDTENVPLTEDMEDYFAREVLPYAPDGGLEQQQPLPLLAKVRKWF